MTSRGGKADAEGPAAHRMERRVGRDAALPKEPDVKIEHAAYQVEDPREAARWYVANLGMSIKRSLPERAFDRHTQVGDVPACRLAGIFDLVGSVLDLHIRLLRQCGVTSDAALHSMCGRAFGVGLSAA